MSIYRPKNVDLKWDTIMDVDVDGVLEGRVKLNKELLLHVCEAKVDSDQPEAGDTFSLGHLWRVMQVLLETTLYEDGRYAQRVQQLEQHAKATAEQTEAQIKALTEELTKVKEENAVLRGEKPGIVPVKGPAEAEEKGPMLTEEEGKALQEKVRKMQEQYTTMMKQKTALNEELQQLKDANAKDDKAAQIKALETQVQELKLEGEKKTQELDTAGKALDGKLNESTQFKNLKMMLGQKNELLKDLRARLQKYEVDPPGGEED
uniref:Leucine zipper transcription factor-like protein 1 n=1 Tax=Eutreptiella gymnastica TaxID=73025 RepID=A0A7S4LM54_9EUGL